MKMQSGRELPVAWHCRWRCLHRLGVAANAQDAPKASGQQATVEGLVIGRDGSTMLVKTADTPRLDVELSDSTKATEKGGFLGWSRKDLGINQPVSRFKGEGRRTYDQDHKLMAKKVEFSRSSMQTAKAIDAGLNPTSEKVAAAQDQLRAIARTSSKARAT